MKQQGRISKWNDDKGFGFVEPEGGGQRAFVHISAFTNRRRRPVEGDTLVYQPVRHSDGHHRAKEITFADERRAPKKRVSGVSVQAQLVGVLFCGVVITACLNGLLPLPVLTVYGGVSVFTFGVYAVDKSASKRRARRTPERTLHILGVMGGWPGALCARHWLRHKSTKRAFVRTFWITVTINVTVLVWLSGPGYHWLPV